MNIAEEFRKRIEASPLLSVFVDRIEEKDYGCVYRFDGKLESAIIDDGDGNLYDAQDINILELDTNGFNPGDWKSFPTVKAIDDRMEYDLR